MTFERTLFGTVLKTVWLGLILLGACKSEEKLPPLGAGLAGPVDVVSSPSSSYFYVLNSDYERRFNQGSILVIDPAASDANYKKTVISVRRLGRTLTVGQNLMLILYDAPENPNQGFVELWDLAQELQPTLLRTWEVNCSPINATIAASRPYFAISCFNGDIYMGGWSGRQPLAASLDRVRSYGHEHRAISFYEGSTKTWLLGFPSDSDFPDHEDLIAVDRKTYLPASDALTELPNITPDLFEETLQARRRTGAPLPFQMFVYPVSDEETISAAEKQANAATVTFEGFRYVESGLSSYKPTLANQELLYVYYVLREADGQPSSGEGSTDLYSKNYRTNFWSIKPSLDGAKDSFFISQRGNRYGSPSNNILKMRLNETELARVGQANVAFENIFEVERIYGYRQDRDNPARFPGDFEPVELENEPMLLINHFRDLINFEDAPFYSISRKYLNEPRSLERPSSIDSNAYEVSYYQLAVANSGKVLTCSFYGNVLFLFDALPRTSIKDQNPIRIE